MREWEDDLYAEIDHGGKELPCPFCSLPRVRRTDYIRCCRCAVNWMKGEPLDRDPREYRRKLLLDQMASTQPAKKPPAEEKPAARNGRATR